MVGIAATVLTALCLYGGVRLVERLAAPGHERNN
jgi:hypothetical protein